MRNLLIPLHLVILLVDVRAMNFIIPIRSLLKLIPVLEILRLKKTNLQYGYHSLASTLTTPFHPLLGNVDQVLVGKALKQLPSKEAQVATKFDYERMQLMLVKRYSRMCVHLL